MTRSTQTSPTLATLVLDHKGDRSYERLSKDCGGEPTGKRLQQIATTPIKTFPDAETIQGIAQGLGVSVTDVVLASARSLGLEVRTDPGPAAVQLDPDIAVEETRHAVLAVVRAVRAAAQSSPTAGAGEGVGQDAATTNQAEVSSAKSASAGPGDMSGQHNVTQLPTAAALDPTLPDDVAARSEKGKGKSQEARERQDIEGEAP